MKLSKYCSILTGSGSILFSIALFLFAYFAHFVVGTENGTGQLGIAVALILVDFTFAGAGLMLCVSMVRELVLIKRGERQFRTIRSAGRRLVAGDSIGVFFEVWCYGNTSDWTNR